MTPTETRRWCLVAVMMIIGCAAAVTLSVSLSGSSSSSQPSSHSSSSFGTSSGQVTATLSFPKLSVGQFDQSVRDSFKTSVAQVLEVSQSQVTILYIETISRRSMGVEIRFRVLCRASALPGTEKSIREFATKTVFKDSFHRNSHLPFQSTAVSYTHLTLPTTPYV